MTRLAFKYYYLLSKVGVMKTSVKWLSTVDVQHRPEELPEELCGRRPPVENVSGRLRPVVKAQSGRRRQVEALWSTVNAVDVRMTFSSRPPKC